jgi:hypothetical protein
MDALINALEDDPEKHAPHLMRAGDRLSFVTNAEHVCAEFTLKQ